MEAAEKVSAAFFAPKLPTVAEQQETVEDVSYGQLSLFATVEEAPSMADRQITWDDFFPPVPLPQEVIDAFLKRGGNKENSTLRICAHYQESWPQEENRFRFLQREFSRGGRGLFLDGKPYAAWFDNEGIRISSGRFSRYVKSANVVSWEQMDARLKELLETGLFLSQEEIDISISTETRECATALCYLQQDVEDKRFLQGDLFDGWYPEKAERVAAALTDPEQLANLSRALDKLLDAFEQDHSLLRFRHKGMDELQDRLHGLMLERRTYTQAPAYQLAPETGFITEDEIDEELRRGRSGLYVLPAGAAR